MAEALSTARERVGMPDRLGTVLDFGCGVGRLAIPLAREADRVVGLDISPAMLREAEANCSEAGIANIEFHCSKPWPLSESDRFELVHSHIVLQHVPVRTGETLLRRLVNAIAPSGTGIIHITYAKSDSAIRWLALARKHVPFANSLVNIARGRPFLAPPMEMNDYDLNRVFHFLQMSGIDRTHVEFTDHGGHLGVSLYFRMPGEIGDHSQLASEAK
ncbi:MAG: class I SAM-dependent methyltransferase [Planctomycetota bacterium]